jgi:hypothetical protein
MNRFIKFFDVKHNRVHRVNIDQITYIYEDLDDEDVTIFLATQENDNILLDDEKSIKNFLDDFKKDIVNQFITVANTPDNGIYHINPDNITYVLEDFDEKDITIYLSTEENDTILLEDEAGKIEFLDKLNSLVK